MSDVPLPPMAMTVTGEGPPMDGHWYTADQMREYAAAVSAADNAALRERVRVLEGALEGALKWGAALSPD